jgi:hypothetical protein
MRRAVLIAWFAWCGSSPAAMVNGGGVGGPNDSSASVHTDAPAPVEPDPSARQLEEDTHVRWIHPGNGMLMPVGLPPPVLDSTNISEATVKLAAIDFLTRYSGLWRMSDPAHELRVSRYTPGAGVTIVFDQWNGGVPVFDTVVLVSFDRKGRLTLVNSAYIPDLDPLPKRPRKSASVIIAILKQSGRACGAMAPTGCDFAGSKATLGILPPAVGVVAQPRLVYKVATAGPMQFIVDANSGEVLAQSSTLVTEGPLGPRRPVH